MNKLKHILKVTGTYLIVLAVMFSGIQITMAAPVKDDRKGHPTGGVKPLSAEDKQWMKENMIKTDSVRLNKIGMERANKIRKQTGLKALNTNTAAAIGEENITSAESRSSLQMNAYSSNNTVQAGQESLPSFVDNSELPYFPPIREQSGNGSCVAFSTAYYQATHMTAMARGWNVKNNSDNSNKFSPKWTYNFINGGSDNGSNAVESYRLFVEHGIATWEDFPYDCDYLEWPTDPDIWKEAAGYKPDKIGYLEIYDGTDTPIVDENDESLANIKQLLCNGYVLSFSTYCASWSYKPVMENTSASTDDNMVGRAACYMMRTAQGNGHQMTIVGYCDDLWVDINGNGNMDAGEKGAFKVANSYGDTWGINPVGGAQIIDGDGFVWLCYDALNKVSSVIPNTTQSRESAMGANTVYWMTAKASNTPLLMAQLTINHAQRNHFRYELGYSEIGQTSPSITWVPSTLNGSNTSCCFDGTIQPANSTNIPDGTILFDYTDLISGINLGQTAKRWYIRITDSNNDMDSTTVKGFKLYIPSTETEILGPVTTIQSSSGCKTLCIDYQLSSQSLPASAWMLKNNLNLDVNYLERDLLYCNDTIYSFAQNRSDTTKDMLLKYSPLLDQWNIFDDNFPLTFMTEYIAHDGKIYAFGEYDGSIGNTKRVKVYDIATKNYSAKNDMPDLRTYFACTESNGKIYIIGGTSINSNGTTVTNTVLVYDPPTDTWSSISGMQLPRNNAKAVSANGKIYVFGGADNNNPQIKNVEEYDPSVGSWVIKSSFPNDLIPIYDLDAVELNGKIYLIGTNINTNCVYEYDPAGNSWTKKSSIPITTSGYGVQKTNGKIYAIVAIQHNVLEFNPSVTETSRVALPYYSLASGAYESAQTVSLSCVTSGATIRYTTDGTTPGPNSLQYTGPITVSGTQTLKAIATKAGMSDSYIASATYTIGLQTKAASPVLSLEGGTYAHPQKVTISSATSGATIRYTMHGIIPNANSPIYTGPLTVSGNATIKAIAVKDGMINSDVVRASYKTGSFVGDVDGSGDVSVMDYQEVIKYAAGQITDFQVEDDMWAGDVNGDGVINADTNGDGKVDAGTDAAMILKYLQKQISCFPKEQPSAPSNPAVKSATLTSVTLGWDESTGIASIAKYEVYRNGVKIGETTGTEYTDTGLTANTEYVYTVKAIDVFDRPSQDSSQLAAVTTPKVNAPVFSISSGTYTSIQTVSISCATDGAVIRYTIDGTMPTASSPIYTGPITVAGTKTIKALATKDQMLNSDTAIAAYTISIRVGDVNGDGQVSSADRILMSQCLLNQTMDFPVEDDLWAGDLNGDGVFNAFDLSLMVQYLNGMITQFPKEVAG